MKFVKNHPALFLEDLKALVIADMHIGLEYDLYKSGLRIPKQTEKMKSELVGLIKKTKAKRLIDLGDVKHGVPWTSFQEKREIPEFYEELLDMVEIDVTPGNHDSNIENLLPPEIKLHGRDGFRDGKYYFAHGQAWPSEEIMNADTLVIGHVHPTIEFKDSFGYRILRPVFLKAALDEEKIYNRYGKKRKMELVVLPTFNRLFSGMQIKTKFRENLLGPLFRNNFVNLDECEVYLLDGTFVGKIKDI